VPVRAPHLHAALRAFCLAAFAQLGPDAGRGGELPFVVEDRGTGLFEYRPLVGDLVDARAGRLAALPDARIAIEELRREPAAAIFAGAGGDEGALAGAILLPLVARAAEACRGLDWEDGAFERVYAELEESLFAETRSYEALAPLAGVSIAAPLELALGIRVRPCTAEELGRRRPEARGLIPEDFGRDPHRASVLELTRDLPGGSARPPDAPGELADAVTALRLATAAPVSAGPVVLERVDRQPLTPRQVLPIAAGEPPGEPTRLDQWRGRLAGDLLERLAAAEADSGLGDAIERWELSLFEDEPLRSEHLRESMTALLGGADGVWAAAMRAALLVGEGEARAGQAGALRALARGEPGGAAAGDAVRRALVETLLAEEREHLISALDDALLGLRTRPPGYFSARAAIRHESGTAA
jgi:hypothetical protein